MQIQTLSPSYVLSLPLILPIITLTPFCHFFFTCSFFFTNALLLSLYSFLSVLLFSSSRSLLSLRLLSALRHLIVPFCSLLSCSWVLVFVPHFISFLMIFFLCLMRADSSSNEPLRVTQGIF